MSTPTTVKNALQAAITKANSTTGKNDTNVTNAVNSLIDGYGKGGGITPSGSLTITENGTFDVTSLASVITNVQGLNARVYTATVASDQTSVVNLVQNDWLKSIYNNANAFAMVRYMGTLTSVAAVHLSLTANFPLFCSGSTVYYSAVLRSSASAIQLNSDARNLYTSSYNGHINITSAGKLNVYGNATYPIKAGTYQIIAGLVEGL